MIITTYLPLAALLALLAGCHARTTTAPNDASTDAQALQGSGVAPSTAAATPPTPQTPADLLADHRREMAQAADDGQYAAVCTGTPWVNSTICNWVAARATGKPVNHPDGELFHGYFVKEHWKHAHAGRTRKTLVIKDEAVPIPHQNLHAIEPPTEKDEEMPRVRIESPLVAHDRDEAIVTASQVDRLGREMHEHARRQRQHRERIFATSSAM